tara:strand:- start:1437 stop:1709 length:273 start_codon:yes stop_codon:yes gene_type:complete
MEHYNSAIRGVSARNEQIVIDACLKAGIPFDEIQPRKNVLPFKAWVDIGRVPAKGSKCICKVPNFLKDKKTGKKFFRPTALFHISQTVQL